MARFSKQTSYLIAVTLALIVLSIIADIVSIPLGVAWGDGGYLRKMNWSLFPIFYLLLGLLVHVSWALYMQAWRSLPKNQVLYLGEDPHLCDSILEPLLERFRRQRFYLLLVALFLGGVLTAIDAGHLWTEYGVLPGPQCAETDFSVAYRMGDTFPSVNQTANGLFNLFVYALQGGLIAYGLLALMQIIQHSLYFSRFENCRYSRQKDLSLRLNIHDPLGEFGLAEVNRALNTVYIAIAMGMIIPVLSATFEQKRDQQALDCGQWLFRFLLPLILLAPLIIPLIDRYFRLKDASARILKSSNEQDAKDFKGQSLWPFDGTQIGYLGKMGAAFASAEYIYLFTRNFLDLI